MFGWQIFQLKNRDLVKPQNKTSYQDEIDDNNCDGKDAKHLFRFREFEIQHIITSKNARQCKIKKPHKRHDT